MYRIAPDRNKAEPLIEQLAGIIKVLIESGEEPAEYNGMPEDSGIPEDYEDTSDE
jgi:hypothetical protein